MGRSVCCRGTSVVAVVKAGEVVQSVDLTVVPVPNHLLHLSDEELVTRVNLVAGHLVDTTLPKPAKTLRVAMVGAWGIPCGIATYAEALWPEVGKLVGDWKVFAEETASGLRASPNLEPGLWKRGQSLIPLGRALEAYKPDCVLIQHEYGLFPDARHWLAFMAQIQPLRPLVTLHSVYTHRDKTICEAACPEIIVHSQAAEEVLWSKGVGAKIHVLPHGCGPLNPKRLFNLYRTPHRFMQFGFGFRYKAWETAIEAVAILKKSFPDVFFTGLFSEGLFSKAEHDRYHRELQDLSWRLGVQENVGIIRGYQSEAVIDSFLATNAAAVFPYKNDPDHVVYGASGAARRAMQAGIPVVVSQVPHFSDLRNVCTRADGASELAKALKAIFTDPVARKAALERQAAFLAANSWAKAAKATVALL